MQGCGPDWKLQAWLMADEASNDIVVTNSLEPNGSEIETPELKVQPTTELKMQQIPELREPELDRISVPTQDKTRRKSSISRHSRALIDDSELEFSTVMEEEAERAIHDISACEADSEIIAVTGRGVLHLLALRRSATGTYSFRHMYVDRPSSVGVDFASDIFCHCWKHRDLFVGTSTGKVLQFRLTKYKRILRDNADNPVFCIASIG
eukprot:955807_1